MAALVLLLQQIASKVYCTLSDANKSLKRRVAAHCPPRPDCTSVACGSNDKQHSEFYASNKASATMSADTKGPFRFTALPREMQTAVAEHLALKDLKNLSLTSKAVRAEVVSWQPGSA